MNRIAELREKRAALWYTALTFRDEHLGQDGFLSDEDEKVYEKMEADVVKLGQEIERLERQAHISREVIMPMEEPMIYEERTNGVNIAGALQEANKILEEMDTMLTELERQVIGKTENDDPTRVSAQCLREEAKFVTGMAYRCLQKVKNLQEALV